MIIPEIDQNLASIKATEIQYKNGYHLTDKDYIQFFKAVDYVTTLASEVKQRHDKEKKSI